jgi:hypothetical protein
MSLEINLLIVKVENWTIYCWTYFFFAVAIYIIPIKYTTYESQEKNKKEKNEPNSNKIVIHSEKLKLWVVLKKFNSEFHLFVN